MNRFDSLRPVTRRALRINYRSPLICTPTNASGSSSSVTSTIQFDAVTQAPGPELKACPTTEGDIVLEWHPLQNVYAYVVYRSTAENGIYTAIASGLRATFFTDNSRIPGTYYYKVTALEPNWGETLPSNIVSATI